MIQYYYPETLKNITDALLERFTHLEVLRYNKARDTIVKTIEVPIAFAPVEKTQQDRLEDYTVEPESTGQRYYLQVPRLALVFNGLAYAPDRATGTNEYRYFQGQDSQQLNTMFKDNQPSPWNFTYTLFIRTDSISDFSQIIENILPYFNPKLYIRVKEFSFLNIERDLSVVLNDVTPDFTDELDKHSMRQINGTITFTVEGWLYRPVDGNSKTVKSIRVRYTFDGELAKDEIMTETGTTRTEPSVIIPISSVMSAHMTIIQPPRVITNINPAPIIVSIDSPAAISVQGITPIVVTPIVPSYFTFGLDSGTDPKLYGSPDLAAWSGCGALPVGTSRVVYGNNTLVALVPFSNPNTDKVYYSVDNGGTWNGVTYINALGACHIKGIGFVNGKFFAYFNVIADFDCVLSSDDGINWTTLLSGILTVMNQTSAKFLYFKGKYCAISSGNGVSYYHELDGGIWSTTLIDLSEFYGPPFLFTTDETMTVSDSYIVAICSYNGSGLYSADGIIWGVVVESHATAFYHIGSKFWAILDFGMSLFINDTTLVQGGVVVGFLEAYKQVLTIDNIVYALRVTENYSIFKSPIPPAAVSWTTVSTGIPVTVQLKQLLE